MTLELKPRMGMFSLLYANIARKWDTIISWERQGLENIKGSALKSTCLFFFEKVLTTFIEVHLPVM